MYKTKILTSILLLVCLSIFLSSGLLAQSLSYENTLEVVLDDGINIKLFRTTSGNDYYYLPPPQSLQLSKKDDGSETPEFLFLKYTTEDRVDDGGVQGGILHFLLEWGLSEEQLEDLRQKVSDIDGGNVKGPVDLQSDTGNSFQIVSAVLTDDEFAPNFVTSGKAPALPGGKAAVAAKLNKEGTQILSATFEKSNSISDVSLALNYSYTVLVEAAEGEIRYNWDLIENQSVAMAHDYIRKELDNEPAKWDQAMKSFNDAKDKMANECGLGSAMGDLLVAGKVADEIIGNTSGGGSGGAYEYYVGENTMKKIYEFMQEKEVITLEWKETIADERLEVIRAAFFEYFLNAFTDQEFPPFFQSDRLEVDGPKNEIKQNAEGVYTFKSCTQMTSQKSKSKVIKLKNITLPVKRDYQMVTNLASTYNQVKDNKNCVASINLNDPFFEHRDINFILDLESHDMFNKEVNYVAVEVRKKRNAGEDFSQSLTIDADKFKNKGARHTLTYARGEDKNPDLYEYKAQWSLKGGQLYPENPGFEKGDWGGITLTPPIKPHLIEFEADLDEMKSLGIVRATLQMRYYKFGKEVETNIPLTVSKKKPLIEETIFTDRDSPGYVYRLVLTHKTKGKLALDWNAKINDDYVYAAIPDELREEDPTFLETIIEAGKEILKPGPDGTIDPDSSILDKFKDVIGVPD